MAEEPVYQIKKTDAGAVFAPDLRNTASLVAPAALAGVIPAPVALASGVTQLYTVVLRIGETATQYDRYAGVLMLSPPAALGVGAFSVDEFRNALGQASHPTLVSLSIGIAASPVIHLALALALWRGARRWFPRTIGR